jgi:hypothetical protein
MGSQGSCLFSEQFFFSQAWLQKNEQTPFSLTPFSRHFPDVPRLGKPAVQCSNPTT